MASRLQSLALLLLAAVCVGAQEPAPNPAQDESTLPIHTLHVYMDLIQVPVLVLDSEHGRMRPIQPASFFVSLDDGPLFHPKNVRQAGDDPITLGILLDPNTEADLMPRMNAAIAGLAPKSLHPHDHVTLYAMDCTLIRTLEDMPAGTDVLKSGADRALVRWNERRRMKPPPECPKPVTLWDAMALAMNALAKLPGRRVLLVVSNGSDSGSRHLQDELRQFAQARGIAIFGYRQGHARVQEIWARSRNGLAMSGQTTASAPEQDEFRALCELSGGMAMSADPDDVGRELTRFVTFVRERYILEFSRPRNDEPGEHIIAVTLPKTAPFAFIRASGVSIMNRTTAPDEDRGLPADDSGAPVYGTKKPPKPR